MNSCGKKTAWGNNIDQVDAGELTQVKKKQGKDLWFLHRWPSVSSLLSVCWEVFLLTIHLVHLFWCYCALLSWIKTSHIFYWEKKTIDWINQQFDTQDTWGEC